MSFYSSYLDIYTMRHDHDDTFRDEEQVIEQNTKMMNFWFNSIDRIYFIISLHEMTWPFLLVLESYT